MQGEKFVCVPWIYITCEQRVAYEKAHIQILAIFLYQIQNSYTRVEWDLTII